MARQTQQAKVYDSFQQVPAPPLTGCHVLGAKKMHKVLKCLLPLIIAAFLTETLSRHAINWSVCDVGRVGTWCHRSGPLGPFGSALEAGVAFLLRLIRPNDD